MKQNLNKESNNKKQVSTQIIPIEYYQPSNALSKVVSLIATMVMDPFSGAVVK
jgi:hypothetical protein